MDAAVAELGARQHAVLDLAQLREVGLSASAVRKRAIAGRLHRIHRGVYSLVPLSLLSREGRWFAAVLACGHGAVLSRASAAALHELRWYGGANVDVTIPTRAKRDHAGVKLHRSITLTADDVTVVNGIPCTIVARTLFDLADNVNRRQLERAFDQAEITGVLNVIAVQDQLARNRSRPAAGRVQAVLDTHYIGSTPTWSQLEEAFLALTRLLGLPDPEVNAWIVLDDGQPAIRADFVWRAQRVIVETDGHQTHRTRQKFELERVQDQRLTVAGWTPIRTTWRQVLHRPRELEPTLKALVSL